MEKKKAKAVLEAILFTMGDSVEIDRLRRIKKQPDGFWRRWRRIIRRETEG